MKPEIKAYNAGVPAAQRGVCDRLYEDIMKALPEAEHKIWHGAPVWFIEGNPVVGYWARRDNVQLLFWSGQSFDEPGLHPEGSFKAAEAKYTSTDEINSEDLSRWLEKAQTIQWDYKNIVKRKGHLERLP